MIIENYILRNFVKSIFNSIYLIETVFLCQASVKTII
jgi:hypothetical protein